MEIANIEVLLLLQLGGIFLAYQEREQLFQGPLLRKIKVIFILSLPIILYVNLLYLGEFR